MAKNRDLPGFFEKRKILFGEKTSPERLRETGKAFLDAERYDDALEFFARAHADDLARQIAERAFQAGNTPLYMRAKKVLNEQITEDEWTRVAAIAEKAGLYAAAYVAHHKAGHAEEAARLRTLMPNAEKPSEDAPEQDARGTA